MTRMVLDFGVTGLLAALIALGHYAQSETARAGIAASEGGYGIVARAQPGEADPPEPSLAGRVLAER